MKKYTFAKSVLLNAEIAILHVLASIPFCSDRSIKRFRKLISKRRATLGEKESKTTATARAKWARIELLELNIALYCLPLSARTRHRFELSVAKRKVRLNNIPASTNGELSRFRTRDAHSALRLLAPSKEQLIDVDRRLDRERHSILVVATHMPTTRHAGGLRILDMIELMRGQSSGVYIELFVGGNKALLGGAGEAYALFDKIVYASDYNFSLSEYAHNASGIRYFDVIDFQFPQPLDIVTSYRSIGDKLIFTPMESLIRTECLKRGVPSLALPQLTSYEAQLEAQICLAVDEVICVSEIDADCIGKSIGIHTVTAVETGVSFIEFSGDVDFVRSDKVVCFVAYFGSETNREALVWYLNNVHPRVLETFGDYEFRIVGRGDIVDIVQNPRRGVTYVGEVERIAPEISRASVGIAPALSGAGFRGKINQYAHLGLPTVATTISARGLKYIDGQSILVSDDPDKFASHIIEMLRNPGRRMSIGHAARNICHEHYSWDSKWPDIKKIYAIPSRPSAINIPSVHAIVPSYQHGSFIEQRIRSIVDQDYDRIRLTVIDDCSTDNSDDVITKLQKEFRFEYIRNPVNSGTPFSAWKYAADNTTEDLIWICESDDACEPTLVPKLVRTMLARPDINMAYCGSKIIDTHGDMIGTTRDYFSNTFHPTRWGRSFSVKGLFELKEFQSHGMVVPNMSSLLTKTDTFRKAMFSEIKDYRLAGDWLFVGRAMQYGHIAFLAEDLNLFRRHPQTARAQTHIARSRAEYISVRINLSILCGSTESEMFYNLRNDIYDQYRNAALRNDVHEHLKAMSPHIYHRFLDIYQKYTSDSLAEQAMQSIHKRRYLFGHDDA